MRRATVTAHLLAGQQSVPALRTAMPLLLTVPTASAAPPCDVLLCRRHGDEAGLEAFKRVQQGRTQQRQETSEKRREQRREERQELLALR